MRTWHVIITCEHGGNLVPKAYRHLFFPYQELLETHKGYDIGALKIAKALAYEFGCPCITSNTTRLLVDLNRSFHHKALFSCVTDPLDRIEKTKILSRFYFPYRGRVIRKIKELHDERKKILHLSIHSFTPILEGSVRRADVGLLFDPSRTNEKRLSSELKDKIVDSCPWHVRLNYPYKGISDGFTTFLRKVYPNDQYAGIEIEINQKLASLSFEHWKYLLLLPLARAIKDATCSTN
jgi:predicted N-formylglutamate amidohydrolase